MTEEQINELVTVVDKIHQEGVSLNDIIDVINNM